MCITLSFRLLHELVKTPAEADTIETSVDDTHVLLLESPLIVSVVSSVQSQISSVQSAVESHAGTIQSIVDGIHVAGAAHSNSDH